MLVIWKYYAILRKNLSDLQFGYPLGILAPVPYEYRGTALFPI